MSTTPPVPAPTEAELLARDLQINAAKNSGAYQQAANHRALRQQAQMDSIGGAS